MPETPEQFAKRQRRWTLLSIAGSVTFAANSFLRIRHLGAVSQGLDEAHGRLQQALSDFREELYKNIKEI